MIRAEFHVHTRYSHDSILNKYLILLMCKIKKIELLAITDHNEIKGAKEYQRFLNKHNIEVIVGEEIMTSSGEIIGLYLKEKIASNLSAGETISLIKEQGGLVYLPHPFDKKRYKTVLDEKEQLKYSEDFDFVEIHNGRNISEEFDIEQEKIQKKIGACPIIGSDAHTFFELGRNYIELEYGGKEALVESVKKADFVGKKCCRLAHHVTKVARLIKLVEKGDIDGVIRIVEKKIKRRK